MSPQPLAPEEQRVKDHWLKYRPRMSAELQKLGHLDNSVKGAVDLMAESMSDLLGSGLDYQSALEKSRPIAYLPDEEDVPELPNNPLLTYPTITE